MTSKNLLDKAKALDITVRIGKSGITDSQINEIKKQLKARKIVKIKLLKSFIENKDRKDVAKELAEKANSKVILAVGFVVVLYKNGIR